MALPTVGGNAITGLATATGGTTSSSDTSTGNGNNGTSTRTVKKIAIGLIIGIVVAVLFFLFFVVIGVVFCLKKKKKQRQLDANAQIIASVQATRPQSMYPLQQQQPPMQMQTQQGPPPIAQQNGFILPQPRQSPQPTINGYFAPPGQNDQKHNGHTSVHEYATTAISNPPTPAPAYTQPYGVSEAPAVPNQPSVHAHHHAPTDGAFEANSIGVSRPAPQQVVSPISPYQSPHLGAHEVSASYQPSNGKPVYEMDQGR